MKLWQVQMDHSARPSALYDLRGTAPLTSLPSSMCIASLAQTVSLSPLSCRIESTRTVAC